MIEEDILSHLLMKDFNTFTSCKKCYTVINEPGVVFVDRQYPKRFAFRFFVNNL